MEQDEELHYDSFNLAGGMDLNPRRFRSNGYDDGVEDAFLRLEDIEAVLLREADPGARKEITEGRGARIRRKIADMTIVCWAGERDGDGDASVTDAEGTEWADEDVFYAYRDGRIRGLLGDEDAGVRALAAGHHRLDDDDLRGLARDPHWLVRREVVLNQACSGTTAEMLVDDPHPDVRYLARRHCAAITDSGRRPGLRG